MAAALDAFKHIARMIGIYDHPRPQVIAPTWPAGHPNRPTPRSGYMRDGRGTVFAKWLPSLRSSRDDIAAAWEMAAARTVELWQNSGWISGMIDQATANTVGTGLRLRAMPENDLFGMDEKAAQAWRKLVEARWDLWSNNPLDCDIEGRLTIAQMTNAAFKTWVAFGEILAEVVWRVRQGSQTGTKVRLLSPVRIVNKTDLFTGLISGVRLNLDGMPMAITLRRENRYVGMEEFELPFRDALGRPRMIHVFEGMPGVTRGIGILVPILRVAKQFDQLADATLLASIIQTVFAASIQSDAPTEEALRGLLNPREQAELMAAGMSSFDAFQMAKEGWAEGHPIDVGFAGRIAHMFPGEKLEFHSPEQPATAYKEFSLHLLREMARCLGLTYESATGDYEGATYSSVRMAVNEIYSITKARRKFLLSPFLQQIYEAWLEEEVEAGRIEFPGGINAFLANRAAACRARWAGDPKPVADDLKAAKSHELYRNMGVMSDDDIATDLGRDIEDVYAQRAREAEMRQTYGLPENFYPQSLIATEQIEAAPETGESGGGNSDD